MKKRGRPSKPPGERKSVLVGLRLTPDLRDRLDKARLMEVPARSITQEVEARVLTSFGEAQRVEDMFGGRSTAALFRVLAEQIRATEISTGQRWWTDAYTFSLCADMIATVLQRLRPKGRRKAPADLTHVLPARTRAYIAQAGLEAIFNQDRMAPPHAMAIANSLAPKFTSDAERSLKPKRKARIQ